MKFHCLLSLKRISLVVVLVGGLPPYAGAADAWKPADGPLLTRWAKDITPENAHREYPRPQMVRKEWINLNGLWRYSIQPKDDPAPIVGGEGDILVPFPIESALSGAMKRVGADKRLWYRREFEAEKPPEGGRLLLHFGAVDWQCEVWVNGKHVGEHTGGYDPFSFDVTDALKDGTKQEVTVAVWDPTDAHWQPRGKQVNNPHGIWYTPVTGIWQTVWLEPVGRTYAKGVTITPDVDRESVTFDIEAVSSRPPEKLMADIQVRWTADTGAKYELGALGRDPAKPITIKFESDLKRPAGTIDISGFLWSPSEPNLIDYEITLRDGQTVLDVVSGYFAMRKIEVRKDEAGVNRLFLNNKPLFQFGPLDQGWWPDGLYTAPTDEALRYDVEITKKLGFNMARKHVKVEPARWYYWCDKLGLLVWQDMPNGDRHIRNDQPDIQRSRESAEQFEREWLAIIDALRNHPSIVMWVPFNEGWGQFDTARVVELTRKHDPTRLVNNASGWTDRGVGDVLDIHRYPGPAVPRLEEKRAAVLGEFGGLGLPLKGHTWQDEKNWGYRSFTSREALGDAYFGLLENLRPLIGQGLAAAVYTQTSDVEIEVNGLMTYDRAVIKLDADRAAEAARRLYLPPPEIKTLVPTSQKQPQTWRFTTERPAEGWEKPDFDDSAWSETPGGFGEPSTPGSVVRTRWKTDDIWLRRTFELNDVPEQVQLMVHHDEDAEVYLNGVPAAALKGYVTEYVLRSLTAEGHKALRAGTNVIAIHCHQTGGGQYIDTGLVSVVEKEPPK